MNAPRVEGFAVRVVAIGESKFLPYLSGRLPPAAYIAPVLSGVIYALHGVYLSLPLASMLVLFAALGGPRFKEPSRQNTSAPALLFEVSQAVPLPVAPVAFKECGLVLRLPQAYAGEDMDSNNLTASQLRRGFGTCPHAFSRGEVDA